MSRRRKHKHNLTNSAPMDWQSERYTNAMYQMFKDDIVNLAMTRFKWVNLPETCDARFLEYNLLYQGVATIAHPKAQPDKIVSLQAVSSGKLNMYGMPTSWRALGSANGTDFYCDWTNGIYIYDNPTRYPIISKINIWARELADIVVTRRINRFHMRMPFLITAPQEKVQDMQNFYGQMVGGEPIVIGYDSLNDVNVTPVFANKSNEFIGDKLDEQYENTWNSIYRMLGIDSLPYKEERMIEDEVSSQMQPTELSQLGPLGCRRAGLAKFNAIHGTNIQCVFNSDVVTSNYDLMHDISKYESVMGGEGDGASAV